METIAKKNSSSGGQGVIIGIIIFLLSILLMGTVSMHINIGENKDMREKEKAEIRRLLFELTSDAPEASKSKTAAKFSKSPYFYLLANTDELIQISHPRK